MKTELVSVCGVVRVIRERMRDGKWRYVREWVNAAGGVDRFEVMGVFS